MGEGEWRVQGNFTVQSDTKISLLSLQCLFRIEIQDDSIVKIVKIEMSE